MDPVRSPRISTHKKEENQMKRKLLSVLLVLAMALTLLPTAAFAVESTASASNLQELKTALENAEVTTITLTQDITGVNETLKVERAVIINFDGKKVSGGLNNGKYIFEVGKKEGDNYTTLEVTFQNAKIENTETTNGRCLEVKPGVTLNIGGDQTSVKGSGNVIVNAGTLKISGGEYTCTDTNASRNVILTGSDVYKTQSSQAVTTIENATLTNNSGIGASALWGATINVKSGARITANGNALGGNNTTPDQNINVEEGAYLESTADAAIYQAAKGSLKITGGEIKGKAGVVARAGTVEITGGTITATGTEEVKVGDRDVKVPASGIVYDLKAAYNGSSETDSKISVSGDAEVKAADQQEAVTLVTDDGDTSTTPTDKLKVTGGSFDKAVDSKYLPAGTVQVKSTDGSAKYFENVDDAKAAAQEGDEISKKVEDPTEPMEPIEKEPDEITATWTETVSGVGDGTVTISKLTKSAEYILKITRGETNVYLNLTAEDDGEKGKPEVICQADAVLTLYAKDDTTTPVWESGGRADAIS